MSNSRSNESPDRPTCPDCGASVIHVRMKGGWRLADWGPVVPVVDFDRMVVATSGDYHKLKDGEMVRDETAYEGFAIGAPAASIIVQLHDCEAITRYGGQMTSRGAERLREFQRRERT